MRQEQRLRTTGDAATYLLDGIAQSGGPREQKGAKRSKKGGHILTKNISFAETETGGQAIIRDRGETGGQAIIRGNWGSGNYS